MVVLFRTGSVLGHEAGAEPFAAGLVGGYLIFGRTTGKRKQSSVNQQICIYVFARVVLGLAKLGFGPEGNTQTLAVAEGTAEKEEEDKLDRKGGQEDIKAVVRRWAWPAFAALSWAGAMAMFRYYPDMLQPSLKSSMQYIFADSDSWDSFRTLVVYNTLTPVNESITTTEGIPTD
ncbi:hypothetical protein ANO11243_044680 [Dothideomycetidae sp. 11243]|nr:hypothetical protein ANO11243_044680 [fungal sp. No.11243]